MIHNLNIMNEGVYAPLFPVKKGDTPLTCLAFAAKKVITIYAEKAPG